MQNGCLTHHQPATKTDTLSRLMLLQSGKHHNLFNKDCASQQRSSPKVALVLHENTHILKIMPMLCLKNNEMIKKKKHYYSHIGFNPMPSFVRHNHPTRPDAWKTRHYRVTYKWQGERSWRHSKCIWISSIFRTLRIIDLATKKKFRKPFLCHKMHTVLLWLVGTVCNTVLCKH